MKIKLRLKDTILARNRQMELKILKATIITLIIRLMILKMFMKRTWQVRRILHMIQMKRDSKKASEI